MKTPSSDPTGLADDLFNDLNDLLGESPAIPLEPAVCFEWLANRSWRMPDSARADVNAGALIQWLGTQPEHGLHKAVLDCFRGQPSENSWPIEIFDWRKLALSILSTEIKTRYTSVLHQELSGSAFRLLDSTDILKPLIQFDLFCLERRHLKLSTATPFTSQPFGIASLDKKDKNELAEIRAHIIDRLRAANDDGLRQPLIVRKVAATAISLRCIDAPSGAWFETERPIMIAMRDEALEEKDFSLALTQSIEWIDRLHSDKPSLTVCQLPFPKASNSEDKDILETLTALNEPMPLKCMPTLSSIDECREVMQLEFPWAADSIDVIFNDLQARALLGCQTLHFEPTLIVGHPGAGKSRFTRRLAEVLGLDKIDVPLGGSSDTKVLAGTSRGWSNGRPNDMVAAMAELRTASIAVILDELDKAGAEAFGASVHSYLLALLEPETAVRFRDSFLKTACDMSAIIWLASANQLSPIPSALQSRMRIFHLEQPKPEHFRAIANGVLTDLAKRWRVESWQLPTVAELDLPWSQLGSAREVRRAVESGVTSKILTQGQRPNH